MASGQWLVVGEKQMKNLWVSLRVVGLCACAVWTCAAQTPAHMKAQEALLAGELAQAATLAESYLRTHPQDAAMLVLQARVSLAQNELTKALAELRRALKIAPQNIDALYYLSLTANALGQQEFRQLYALAPDSAPIHLLLAEAALAQDNQAEAETEYQLALKADARNAEAALGWAELKRTQSKFDEALALYQQAETLVGLNHDIAYGLGACFSFKQEHERAVSYLRQAAAFAPEADATQFALGNALFQSGKLAEAVAPLQRAVALNPKIKQAYFLLGRAYQRTGQAALAKVAFKRVDELSKEELQREQGTAKPTKP